MSKPNVLWFRHGLRIHDNPALLEAIGDNQQHGNPVLPVFIFDGESAGTKVVGYNRMRFLLDSLHDLDQHFRAQGGRLYLLQGNPTNLFRRLKECLDIGKIYYEQDCEPIWKARDRSVERLCSELNISHVEKISHTLWNPELVIKTNGGIPPLTYQMFLHTVNIIGAPPRPVRDPDWNGVRFVQLPIDLLMEFQVLENPKPEDFSIYPEGHQHLARANWEGGETQALLQLQHRLQIEKHAFKCGYYLPNQALPNIIDPPTSMSAYLRFGCLSVRKFYWDVHDLFDNVNSNSKQGAPGGDHITGQLIWREYFYTMSVTNPNYAQVEGNDICLNIPWAIPSGNDLDKWRLGKTGFPLIDAAMRQLLAEGWLHHVLRNTVATFLTRGGLWLSWEHGFQHFLKYLLDADWSICAGNWMWVSSSSFEKLLDSSQCTCPIAMGKRLDPNGVYIKRYVPELTNLPEEFIHEPWRTPVAIQKKHECIIGENYPNRMIDLDTAVIRNSLAMAHLRRELVEQGAPEDGPPHCGPFSEEEVRRFFWISEDFKI